MRGDGGRFTTPTPSRLEARSRLGDKAACRGAEVIRDVGAIGRQPAALRISPFGVQCRDARGVDEVNDRLSIGPKHRITDHHQRCFPVGAQPLRRSIAAVIRVGRPPCAET